MKFGYSDKLFYSSPLALKISKSFRKHSSTQHAVSDEKSSKILLWLEWHSLSTSITFGSWSTHSKFTEINIRAGAILCSLELKRLGFNDVLPPSFKIASELVYTSKTLSFWFSRSCDRRVALYSSLPVFHIILRRIHSTTALNDWLPSFEIWKQNKSYYSDKRSCTTPCKGSNQRVFHSY